MSAHTDPSIAVWPNAWLRVLILLVLETLCLRTVGAQNEKVFQDSIVSLPKGAVITKPAPSRNGTMPSEMYLKFSIKNSNASAQDSELEARILAGQPITAGEMKASYSGDAKAAAEVREWLEAHDFKVVTEDADSSNVYVTAPTSVVEKQLNVKILPVEVNGHIYPSATTPPSLPESVGKNIIDIGGLQTFEKGRKHLIARTQYLKEAGNGKQGVTPRRNFSPRSPYKVRDIMRAYNIDSVDCTGKGQAIAILIDTLPTEADFNRFMASSKISQADESRLHLIDVQGGGDLPNRDGEETLDAEWAGGIASGADIFVFAAGSLEYPYLDRALEKIYEAALDNPALRQVSISLGLREDLVSAGEIRTEHSIFRKLAALGVSTFVSSGDAGSSPDRTGHSRSTIAGDDQVEFEASDPFVVAVGGTSLWLDGSGNVTREEAWQDGGGGISKIAEMPSWQANISAGSLLRRGVPDVSSAADPLPGGLIVFKGSEFPIGGTSWSAPTWAGICAILAEARVKSGKRPIGYITPSLYHLSGSKAFRDITSGGNGTYKAEVGWDAATGLGTPDVLNLLNSMQ